MFFQPTANYQLPQFFPQLMQGNAQNYQQTQPTAINQQFQQYPQQSQPQPAFFNQQFPQYNRSQPTAFNQQIQQYPKQPQPQYVPVNKAVQQSPKPAAVPSKKSVSTSITPERFTAKGLNQDDLDEIISKYGDEIDDIFNLAPGQA